LENGQTTTAPLACNDPPIELKVNKKAVYVIVLQAPQFSGGLQYFQYSVTITVGQ
jgi:hypothetical protein